MRMTLLTAATVCSVCLATTHAHAVPDDTAPASPTEAVADATDNPALTRAEYETLLLGAVEDEEQHRHRLGQLRRLHELALAAGDRVRVEQLAAMRDGLVRRHHGRRSTNRAALPEDWRTHFDALLELGGRGPDGRALTTTMPKRQAAPPSERDDAEPGQVFAERRAAARTRMNDRRSEALQRQRASRSRVQSAIANGRAVQSYRNARPTTIAPVGTRESTHAGRSTDRGARPPSTSNPARPGRTAPSTTQAPTGTPDLVVRLITHGEAYARASTRITEQNASQTFWRVKKELAREARAAQRAADATPASAPRAHASNE